MGNFFTNLAAGVLLFKAAHFNTPFGELDKAITYRQNTIVHCDGDLSYDKATGVFSWSATLRILFNSAAGLAIQNTVAAGSITLADNEFAYVTLSETNNAALTAAKAAVTTAAASNFLALGRLVLGYRNTTSDEFYVVGITHPLRKIEAHIADPSGGTTVDAEARAAINSILAVLEARKIVMNS